VAAISAYAELIEHGARTRPDDLDRAVRAIRGESGRLGALVEDLLALARLDEPGPDGVEPVELVALAAEAVEAARAIAPDWPVRLVAARPVDTHGHPGHLRRVVDNLLANVRAHTPPGTPCEVIVSCDEHRARCTIAVADRGPGLDDAGKAAAFDRFWRADRARRAGGGAGLGLAIVAAIADAHGGTASLADADPSGLVVTVELPLRPA
jgi:two-component system OmpR family sensor kinase